MTYYKTCDVCGANLDPGERCDCIKTPAADLTRYPVKGYIEHVETGHCIPVMDIPIRDDSKNRVNADNNRVIVDKERGLVK